MLTDSEEAKTVGIGLLYAKPTLSNNHTHEDDRHHDAIHNWPPGAVHAPATADDNRKRHVIDGAASSIGDDEKLQYYAATYNSNQRLPRREAEGNAGSDALPIAD